jgi:wyosine [tRNA(Phe)-imidazoG37] synthetase (radical SAM superfamily)
MSEVSYIFGPVPSRRLGLSLGVDIIPFKSCTQDCIYCQLGQAANPTTTKRGSFVSIDEVMKELEAKLEDGVKADYITLSGSGEPTLNKDIGKFIARIKEITDIPVAIITNGTLLHRSDVCKDIMEADLVVPSLDATDDKSFGKINRPHSDISFGKLVDGLIDFRKEYKGKLWLEIFLVEGLNTSDEQIEKLKSFVDRIGPDRVQLNTAVRPTAVKGLKPALLETMQKAVDKIGGIAEVIADFDKITERLEKLDRGSEQILETLKRRPCTLEDLASSLNIAPSEAVKYLTQLLSEEKITVDVVGEKSYYKPI